MAVKWAEVEASEKYKTANPELKLQIQDKFFDTFVKPASGYNPKWESQIKTRLFGQPRDLGAISAFAYSIAEAVTRIPHQLAIGFEKAFPQPDLVTIRKSRLEKRRPYLTPEQITKEETNIKQVEDFLKIEQTQKVKLDREIAISKRRHPVASFVGGAGGGVVPYMAAAVTGLPLWASFGGLGFLEEASRQYATPEEQLTPIQRVAKISISTAANIVTGQIFQEANLGKTFLSRALRRSAGAGATTITESIVDEFASGKPNPDVGKALLRGGTTAVSIAVLSYLTELPELKGAVWNEANGLAARAKRPKPATYEEAKAIVKEASINPEELSPTFIKAKNEFVKAGLKRDVAKNIEYYKKNLGWSENQINEFLNIKSLSQFDNMVAATIREAYPQKGGIPVPNEIVELFKQHGIEVSSKSYIDSSKIEFIKKILPFRKDIASGLTTPEEIMMAMELREMAKPKTTISEVVKTEKPTPVEKTYGEKLKEAAVIETRTKAVEAGIPLETKATIQPVPIQLPEELTKGEHIITPEQSLDKTVADLEESQFTQNDIFETSVRKPIQDQIIALKEQLTGLKGQRGGETALIRKDINTKLETLQGQLNQAESTIQDQQIDWSLRLNEIVKQKAKEQGLQLTEEEEQELADEVSMTISEPWGREKYWETKIGGVVDNVIQDWKRQISPEAIAKEKEIEETRMGMEKEAKLEVTAPKEKDKLIGEISEKSVTSNYKLEGYYGTSGATEKDDTEYGNIMPAKKFKKDLLKFAKALKEELGWEYDIDRKGKQVIADTNIAPIGGDGTIILWKPNSEYGIYITISTQRVNGDDLEISGMVDDIMYRATTKKDKYTGKSNNFTDKDITVGKMAELARKEVAFYEEPIEEKKPEIQKPLTKEEKSAIFKVEAEDVQKADDLRRGLQRVAERPGGGEEQREPTTVSDIQGRQQSIQSEVKQQRSAQYNQESNEETRKANLGNYRITTDDQIGVGTPKEKYRNNIAAIKLLKKIESENRKATPEEQKILVKYVGWGGLSKVFDRYDNKGWEKEYKELEELLTEEEYRAARTSTVNAHYTSQEVILAMWQAVTAMGFERGKVLEPAMGIGHFIGLRPEAAKIAFTGVELDSLTGRIAKQLYQNGDVQIKGFEEIQLSRNFYDLAISNVPFADVKPYDPKAKELGIPPGLNLHDYFFAKTLVLVKPGGIIAFITSKGTMDKQDSKLREHIAKQADLLGAIRLPKTAFKATAGTEVTTDIIFLRKRLPREQPAGESWINSVETKISNRNINVNEYFIKNTAMVLGNMKVGHGLYAADELSVEPMEEPLVQSLNKAIDFLPKDIIKSQVDVIEEEKPDEVIPDSSNIKQGAFTLKDGKIYQKEGENLVEQQLDVSDKARLIGMIQIRDAARDLLTKQLAAKEDKTFKQDELKLNSLYDKFVKKYGFLNSTKNEDLFWDDPDSPLLLSLEVEDKKNKIFRKAPIFTERVIRPHVRPTQADTAQDAVFISLAEYGHLNWKYMSELTSRIEEDLQKELSDANIVYKNPEGEKYELKDEYLVGNVKLKLRVAEAAAKIDPTYTKNITVLKEIIPTDLTFNEIDVRLGTPWIETEDYKEFIAQLLQVSRHNVTVEHNVADGRWNLDLESYAKQSSANTEQWGTSRYPAINLMEAIANHKLVRVLDKITEEGVERYVVNEQETAVAQDKAEILKQKFKDWFWTDEERRNKYVRIYNDNFNTSITRKYDGSHLTLPGMSNIYKLRKTQLDAIWRAITSRSILLAHEVGAGKTLIGIAALMESKRLGLINKPIIVVPRNTLSQWKREFNKLYPAANILVADERNFQANRRKKFLGKIATGNWDAIITSDSSNFLISVSDESYQDYIQEQVDEYRALADRARDLGENKSVKQLEKSILKLEERLKRKLDQTKKDATVTFEELGIDAVFVDEADRFKNLAYTTKMENVRGLGDPSGSKRAEDLAMKIRHIRNKGGKIIFATGTPVSNTMAEVHVMMKYLQPDLLDEKGLKHFDDWANAFGEVVNSLEVDASGAKYKSVARFSKFVNIPELLTMLQEVWDIQTAEMLEKAGILVKGVNLPLIKGGKATAAILNPSQELKEYIQELGLRADKIKGKRPEKGGDNMLVILHDGIIASTDMRLIDPTLPGNPESKIEVAISGIFERWEKNKDTKATQIIFLDRTKPDEKAAFNPQYYMRNKLVEMGIPEKEIAFIHEFDTMDEKDDLYTKVNNGDIRVLFGSTEKLGAGTNVQERLMTLWHIDTPFRPRDIMQREGRIMRPGNTNKEIEIIRLVTKGSLDTFMWQMLEAKAKAIAQVMSGQSKDRVMVEEVDDYSIIKAASSDNPLLREKVEVDKEVRRLTTIKNAFLQEKFKAQQVIKEIPKEIEGLKKRIEAVKEDISKRPGKPTKENFKIEISGKDYATKEDAWIALKKTFDSVRIEDWNKEIPVGKYQGFDISIHVSQDVTNLTRKNRIMVKGAVNYEAIFSDSAIGTFASLDNALYSWPEKVLENATMRYEETNKHLIISKSIAEKDFEYEKNLAERSKRQIEVNRLLRADAEGKERKEGEDVVEMHAGFIFGMVKEEPVDDNLNTDPATFIDSDVERRFKEAHGQQNPNTIIFKLKQSLISLWESRKVFPMLPETEYYADAKFILGIQKHAREVARDKTVRNISYITYKFGAKKLNLFTRAVILADFTQEAEKGRPVPLGYSYYEEDGNVVINTDLLKKDKANIDALVELNPDVKEALEKRKAIIKQVSDDLVKYKILTKEQIKEDYYRHQVLEYANAKAVYSVGKKLKTPHPGYARRRYGTVDKDINTNYLEAEFEFMAQAYYDIETAKNIDKFRISKYNIKDSLRQQARKHNDEMLDRVTIEGEYNKEGEPATLRDLIKPFNSKIGWGFSLLEKAGYEFAKGDPETFEELSRLAESEDDLEAQKAARMILKAISNRREFIKKNLGKHYQEWQDIIPDGYTAWQPREGRMFYNAFSIPQRIINEVVSKAGEDVGINQEDLKKLLAVGGMREEFVIPQELADSLNQLYTIQIPNWLNDAVKSITTMWKKWVLFNPRRAFSYNFQNFLGDSDHVIAANPRILRFFNRATQELYDMFYKGKVMTPEMREFFERGGLSTMLTIQEIPDINTLEVFLRMTQTAENMFSLEQAQIVMKKAWNFVIRFTMFRESILRYAAYLHYREVFLSGRKEYGGSRREDVEGIVDPLDKAAKVATDTLGDYSNISQFMTDARHTLIPFGSWLEINFKIYYNLNRNAWTEGGVGKGVGTAFKTGLGAGVRATTFAVTTYLTFLLRCILMTALVALYNQLFHREEESNLNPYDQNRMHITIGRDKYGHVKIRRGQGAFSDLLEWVGLDQLNTMLRDYWDGKASLTDIFGKIPFVTGKIGLKPVYLKIMRGINPIYKAMFETATGKYLPGLDERSGTIEDKMRNILKAWQLENEYDWITKKPSRGYIKSWEQAFITTTDPEENAFRYIQGLKYAYREKLGKGGSGDHYTPRSILYRQYKKALLYKDEGARVAALKEMIKLGVTMEDLERSVKTNDPLNGLNDSEKQSFVKYYLSVRDRDKLRTAYKYYIKTFLRPTKK